jgi:hypothetical protein
MRGREADFALPHSRSHAVSQEEYEALLAEAML